MSTMAPGNIEIMFAYGREAKRVHFDTKSGNVFFLEFTCQVAFDKGGLWCVSPLSRSANLQ